MNLFLRLLITAVSAYLLTYVLSGVQFSGFTSTLIFALVLGLLNLIVKPILKLLGLPLTIITLGLFSLVINAIIIMLADYFIDGMTVDGFWWALIFSVVLSLVTSVFESLLISKEK